MAGSRNQNIENNPMQSSLAVAGIRDNSMRAPKWGRFENQFERRLRLSRNATAAQEEPIGDFFVNSNWRTISPIGTSRVGRLARRDTAAGSKFARPIT
jgi:hypothetical protein